MAVKVGFDGKVLRGSSLLSANFSSTNGSTWTEVQNVRDITSSSTGKEVDVSDRSSVYEKTLTSMLPLEMSFKMNYDPADADLLALQTAHHAKTQVAMMFADAATWATGTIGLGGNFSIVDFTKEAALDGAFQVNVVAKHAGYGAIATKA